MSSSLNRRLFLTGTVGTVAAVTLAACGGGAEDEPAVAEVEAASAAPRPGGGAARGA